MIFKLLFVVIVGLFAWVSFFLPSPTVPYCNDEQATLLVQRMVNNRAKSEKLDLRFLALPDVIERGYNETKEERHCLAELVTTVGSQDLLFVVRWQDKSNRRFTVDLQTFPAEEILDNNIAVEIPSCDSPKTTERLGSIIQARDDFIAEKAIFVGISLPMEVAYNKKKSIRVCDAYAVTKHREVDIRYTIEWIDEAMSDYKVEMKVVR